MLSLVLNSCDGLIEFFEDGLNGSLFVFPVLFYYTPGHEAPWTYNCADNQDCESDKNTEDLPSCELLSIVDQSAFWGVGTDSDHDLMVTIIVLCEEVSKESVAKDDHTRLITNVVDSDRTLMA